MCLVGLYTDTSAQHVKDRKVLSILGLLQKTDFCVVVVAQISTKRKGAQHTVWKKRVNVGKSRKSENVFKVLFLYCIRVRRA
jgi:hypothetical protein